MVKFLVINLFMAIMVFASAGFALQSIRASHDAALWDDVATQVELNRIQLESLKEELDQLDRQVCFIGNSLGLCYEYLDVCSTWEMKG
jgi:hypothetical protein